MTSMTSSAWWSSALGWGACLGIACTYVGSLYLWRDVRGLPRDHPKVIRRRFASLAATCAVAWTPLWRALRADPAPEVVLRALGESPLLHSRQVPASLSLVRALGLEVGFPPLLGAATSVAATLGLTAALFLGPLTTLYLDGELVPRFADALRLDSIHKVRNLVVAPATEEFAFRSCMAPLLLYSGAASVRTAVFTSPLFFGVAHAHHFADLRRRVGNTSAALVAVACQFAYTTIFGWFATFAFLRTGHILGPVASHVFCNVVGFPDVARAASHRERKLVGVAYAAGIAAFAWGLWPATDAAWHPCSSWPNLVTAATQTRAP